MQLTSKEIKEKITEILEVDPRILSSLQDDVNLLGIGFNSIQFISLVVLLEDSYHIHFDDDDLLFTNIDTIGKIKSIMKKYESTV